MTSQTQNTSSQTASRPIFAVPGSNLTVRTGIRGGAMEARDK